MTFKTRVFLIKLIILFSVIGLGSCRSYRDGIPPANLPHPVSDSWYFGRDTLNFYQAVLSEQVVSVIDSVVGDSLTEDNRYWVLEVNPEGKKLKEFCLSIIYVEKVLFYNSQDDERVFKAYLHNGRPLLIIDGRNTIRVDQEKPLVKIYNPRKMDTWLFRLDGKRDCFKLEKGTWARHRRF